MFHAADGWFFKRNPDGSVHIEKRKGGKEDGEVEASGDIGPNPWASVVATVSARNETDATWNEAMKFHMRED